MDAERLGDRRCRRGEQDAGRADLADGELHRLGRAEADAVAGPRHEPLEQARKAAGADVLDRVGAALGDRHHSLADRHEADVVAELADVARDHGSGVVSAAVTRWVRTGWRA